MRKFIIIGIAIVAVAFAAAFMLQGGEDASTPVRWQ
jgi:hypothetical protein